MVNHESLPPPLVDVLETATGPFHFEGDTYVVFRGPADRVELVTWMPSFPAVAEFRRLGTDIFFLRLPLPATARIEYRLRVAQGRRHAEIDDPLNPPATSNPFGENSVARWRNKRWISGDLSHLTGSGQRVLGQLVYLALMKGYREYRARTAK